MADTLIANNVRRKHKTLFTDNPEGEPVRLVVYPTSGDEAVQATRALGDGEILVLENTRYHAGEEKNDADLSRQFAELGDVYVNDAFGAAHRAHSSTAGIASVVRERGGWAAAGLLAGGAAAQEAPRSFEILDQFRFTNVGSPAVSPDGRSVAYTIGKTDWEEKERSSRIWMQPFSGGEGTPFITGGSRGLGLALGRLADEALAIVQDCGAVVEARIGDLGQNGLSPVGTSEPGLLDHDNARIIAAPFRLRDVGIHLAVGSVQLHG